MGTPIFMGDFNTDVNSYKMRRRDVELLHLVHDCIFCIANLLECSNGSLYNMTMNTVLLLTIYVEMCDFIVRCEVADDKC